MPCIQYIIKSMSKDRRAMVGHALKIIEEYQLEGYSLTLRQLYYQFVSRDLLPNSVKSYKLLGDVVSDGRMLGLIDWDAINDRLREIRTVTHWDTPKDILEACASQFRIDMWDGQLERVEVWVEKDALAEVVVRAANIYRCPVMVCRGYMSQSAMWEAGHRRFRNYIARGINPTVIHLGDHDPSGIDMTRDIEDRLRIFSRGHVSVERIALNMDQVKQYNPPPNPAKLTDTRARDYISVHGDMSWELDALEPRVLDTLIQDAIKDHIDWDAWNEKGEEEETHRHKLKRIANDYDSI